MPHKLHPLLKKQIEKVCTIEGVDFFKFSEMEDLPEIRRAFFGNFSNEYRMGLTAENLITLVKALLQANNERDISKVGFLGNTIIETVENCRPTEALYHMAALVYFTEDEDLSRCEMTELDRKVELFKQKGDAFFLPNLLHSLGMFQGESKAHIQAVLQRNEIKMKAVDSLISGLDASPPTSA